MKYSCDIQYNMLLFCVLQAEPLVVSCNLCKIAIYYTIIKHLFQSTELLLSLFLGLVIGSILL